MDGTLSFLLFICLLQGALCDEFKVSLPQSVRVLRGSCVTVPCSFDIKNKYENDLNAQCETKWFSSRNQIPQLASTGDITKKNCTTTFSNLQLHHSDTYHFRLECQNSLKYNFITGVRIEVTDAPPSPTLTPPTLNVKEGSSVSLSCSAPAPCLDHPPTLTWTSTLGHIQETLQENQDQTKVQTSVLNFTASHLHHGRTITCTAVYKKQDGSSDVSVSTSLTANILYSPRETSVSASPSGPVLENSNVSLTCSGNANPAVRTYTWYRDDGGQETALGTRHILNIKVSIDRCVFFCKAENDLGDEQSDLIHIDVQYSPKETSVSASPSGPVLENSNVSLTCSGNANPAVRTYTWYRADGGQETFIGPGRVLNITASIVNRVFFCKAENAVGVERSNNHELDVQFPPQILPSSDCSKTSTQVSCSCETVGNPPPTVLWHLDGQPVNQNKDVVAVYESLNNTNQRSIITVNQPQDTDLSTLLCFSSNSLGSASKLLCADCLQVPVKTPDQIPVSVFIITVSIFLVLVCVLLCVIRFQKTHHSSKGSRGEENMVPSPIAEGNEAPNTTEDGIYTSAKELRQEDSTLPATVSESQKTSGEDGQDVVYTSVDWTKQGKRKKNGESSLCGSSYQEEEKSVAGGLGSKFMSNALETGCLYAEVKTRGKKKEVECDYAPVKFKNKNIQWP